MHHPCGECDIPQEIDSITFIDQFVIPFNKVMIHVVDVIPWPKLGAVIVGKLADVGMSEVGIAVNPCLTDHFNSSSFFTPSGVRSVWPNIQFKRGGSYIFIDRKSTRLNSSQ